MQPRQPCSLWNTLSWFLRTVRKIDKTALCLGILFLSVPQAASRNCDPRFEGNWRGQIGWNTYDGAGRIHNKDRMLNVSIITSKNTEHHFHSGYGIFADTVSESVNWNASVSTSGMETRMEFGECDHSQTLILRALLGPKLGSVSGKKLGFNGEVTLIMDLISPNKNTAKITLFEQREHWDASGEGWSNWIKRKQYHGTVTKDDDISSRDEVISNDDDTQQKDRVYLWGPF